MTRALLKWAVVLLCLKLLIAVLFPVIGDEAYYFYWGLHPAGGYYDLPPMIGWWLIPFSKVSSSSFWLRLPNLISIGLIAFGIYEWLKEAMSKSRAAMIAGIFLFLPLPFVSVLMFPDIPLLLFSFYSALLFYRAAFSKTKASGNIEFFLSGALWGAAFLSKYFALLMLPAFVLWYLFQKRKTWTHVISFAAGALPFLFQHLYWNRTHCWANFVFNLVSRQNANDGTVFQTFGLFLVYLVLASTPYLWRPLFSRVQIDLEAGFETNARLKELDRFFFFLWMVPVVIFGTTAILGRGQGLHWLLFLTPYFAVTAGLRIPEMDLGEKLKKIMGLAAVVSGFVFFSILFPDFTVGSFFKNRLVFDYKLITHTDEFMTSILPDLEGVDMVFTESYSLSSVLDHEFRRYGKEHGKTLPEVSVWGGGSRFGRVFDWTMDWKKLEGKKIAIVTPGLIGNVYWSRYFKTTEAKNPRFLNQTFFVLVGRGFKAIDYERQEFKNAIRPFYPPFLPGVCSLKD